MQRVGQPCDVAHAVGHFHNSALRRPQTREHGARHLTALDRGKRRRTILFIRGENLRRTRFDGAGRGKQSFVAPLA